MGCGENKEDERQMPVLMFSMFSYDGGGGGITWNKNITVSLVSLFFLLPFSNDYELLMNYYELIYDDYE